MLWERRIVSKFKRLTSTKSRLWVHISTKAESIIHHHARMAQIIVSWIKWRALLKLKRLSLKYQNSRWSSGRILTHSARPSEFQERFLCLSFRVQCKQQPAPSAHRSLQGSCLLLLHYLLISQDFQVKSETKQLRSEFSSHRSSTNSNPLNLRGERSSS